uniref:60S ribosomal protein L36 n=1 Tax=Lotharella oceanica TaxID=641309 RepID=A0A7S2TGT1_9EUKA|mmetsp:Transcript_13594/g.25927  ORF Transcript_13594/g.25927 Transcript_13594/m.25927 type:complete len:119 (+) Transcript_13594:38-394(+)
MSGIATGANKGFIVTKRPLVKSARKWYLAKGATESKKLPGRRVKVIRAVVRETVGYAPYERRIIEILKGGGSNPQKKAWRFAKQRLGTHIRAKKKVAEMERVASAAPKKKKTTEKKGK